jgi:hypothetical protein
MSVKPGFLTGLQKRFAVEFAFRLALLVVNLHPAIIQKLEAKVGASFEKQDTVSSPGQTPVGNRGAA